MAGIRFLGLSGLFQALPPRWTVTVVLHCTTQKCLSWPEDKTVYHDITLYSDIDRQAYCLQTLISNPFCHSKVVIWSVFTNFSYNHIFSLLRTSIKIGDTTWNIIRVMMFTWLCCVKYAHSYQLCKARDVIKTSPVAKFIQGALRSMIRGKLEQTTK